MHAGRRSPKMSAFVNEDDDIFEPEIIFSGVF